VSLLKKMDKARAATVAAQAAVVLAQELLSKTLSKEMRLHRQLDVTVIRKVDRTTRDRCDDLGSSPRAHLGHANCATLTMLRQGRDRRKLHDRHAYHD